jgi:hypothetical protein
MHRTRLSITAAVCLSLPLIATTLATTACGGSEAQPQDCSASGETKGAVVTFATFARLTDEDKLLAEGIDLDGHDSQRGGETGCAKQDFVSSDGRKGIDNQFGLLLPIIESYVGTENIDALLTAAIANGQLLLMTAVRGIDDPMNDDCVDVMLGAGLGTPYLDTQGTYERYQTFGFDDSETPVSTFLRGRISNGVLEAGPAPAVLPVRILDAAFDLVLLGAHLRMKVTHDPLGGGITLEGIVAGGIGVEQFRGIVEQLNIGSDVVSAVLPIVGTLADLGPDENGNCHHLSAGLHMKTTEAFLIEE